MSHESAGPPAQPLVEFAITFRHPDGGENVYLVKGVLGPPPYAACCNVLRVDARAGGYAEPEVVTAETGTLTDLFRRVETVLAGRHPGCQKAVTFDFTKRS
jgi:hypothetical protein